MTLPLRPYQQRLREANAEAWARVRNVLDVSATGSGKTVVAAAEMADEPGASVFIAHRSELVTQASLALGRAGLRHNVIGPGTVRRNCVAIHMAEFGRTYYDPNARCAVAGVDTLINTGLTNPWLHHVKLWICDEAAHLLKINKWGRAVAMFPNARGLGFTATPVRSDGAGLGRHADGVFDEMVLGPPMRQLIEEKYLTPYRVFAPPNALDVRDVPITAAGDFSPVQLRKAVHKAQIVGDVVGHYIKLAPGKLGMTFCVDVESAAETAQAFNAAGVKAEVVTGNTDPLLRAHIMRRFRAREIHQLVSVDIMGEGVDVPAVEVVQFARPTQSLGLYIQQFGRVERPMEGKQWGIVIDHVDNVRRHGLPDAPRVWTLDRRERRSRGVQDGVIPLRTCLNTECFQVYERVYRACPYCGTEPVPAGRSSPEQVDGDLVELDPSALARINAEIERIRNAPSYAGVPRVAWNSFTEKHEARAKAQSELVAAMTLWGGWQSHLGRSVSEGQRRFFFAFGVDVATAQTLGKPEAEALTERIKQQLQVANVQLLGSN